MKTLIGFRLLMAIVGIAVVAVPVFVVKGMVSDTVDEATTAAGFQNVPADPTDISGDESLYRQESFAKALDEVRERAGSGAELLKVGVLPYMAEFQVAVDGKPKGYRYYAKNGETGEYKVKIVGNGSIAGAEFAFDTVDAGITTKLASAVVERDGALSVTNMNLERDLTDGKLAWSVNAESDERTGIVFQARPDGSGLADPTAFARRAAGGQGGSSGSTSPVADPATDAPDVSDLSAKADCIQAAGTDVAKLQACTK